MRRLALLLVLALACLAQPARAAGDSSFVEMQALSIESGIRFAFDPTIDIVNKLHAEAMAKADAGQQVQLDLSHKQALAEINDKRQKTEAGLANPAFKQELRNGISQLNASVLTKDEIAREEAFFSSSSGQEMISKLRASRTPDDFRNFNSRLSQGTQVAFAAFSKEPLVISANEKTNTVDYQNGVKKLVQNLSAKYFGYAVGD